MHPYVRDCPVEYEYSFLCNMLKFECAHYSTLQIFKNQTLQCPLKELNSDSVVLALSCFALCEIRRACKELFLSKKIYLNKIHKYIYILFKYTNSFGRQKQLHVQTRKYEKKQKKYSYKYTLFIDNMITAFTLFFFYMWIQTLQKKTLFFTWLEHTFSVHLFYQFKHYQSSAVFLFQTFHI